MPHRFKLRQLVERVLRAYPDFMIDDDPNATQSGGFRIEIRRMRKAYGTFSDSDKMRTVQRDILSAMRNAGFTAKLGQETRDDFVIRVKEPPPAPKNLLEEATNVIREREDSNQKVGKVASSSEAAD